MCGVIGIVGCEAVNQTLYDGLTVLQHRGQDAAGIVTYDGGRLFMRRAQGLVRDVFHTRHMRRFHGSMGIGHVRYPTAGCNNSFEAQPFYVNSPYGIVLAHNGNLTNTDELAQQIYETDLRHLSTTSDSEVLLNVFAHELAARHKKDPQAEDLFEAVTRTFKRIRGAYAVVGMVSGMGIFAFRDPRGIRPLCIGSRMGPGNKTEYALASESVAFAPLGFTMLRDVAPGEAVFIDAAGDLHTKQCTTDTELTPCLFELVYLARPDSIIDDISVHKSRLRMGEYLAEKIKRTAPNLDIDVVIPIPESSRTAALQVAHGLGVKYREGFIKNRYIGRTFIMPGQKTRRKSVRYKLSAIDLEFRGKNVLLVDDSIVRGTTSKEIIRMAREKGAKKVYFASAAPPVRYPNVYGIDMPTRKELVAYGISDDEVGKFIGADGIFYQALNDLVSAAQEGNPKIKRFDASCFDGDYITGDVDDEYLHKIESGRGSGRSFDDDDGENPMTLL